VKQTRLTTSLSRDTSKGRFVATWHAVTSRMALSISGVLVVEMTSLFRFRARAEACVQVARWEGCLRKRRTSLMRLFRLCHCDTMCCRFLSNYRFWPQPTRGRLERWLASIMRSQLHNRCIRMGTQRLADKGTNCKDRDCAGGDGRGDDSGGFETRPYVRDA